MPWMVASATTISSRSWVLPVLGQGEQVEYKAGLGAVDRVGKT